jgi:hypothetical protein
MKKASYDCRCEIRFFFLALLAAANHLIELTNFQLKIASVFGDLVSKQTKTIRKKLRNGET